MTYRLRRQRMSAIKQCGCWMRTAAGDDAVRTVELARGFPLPVRHGERVRVRGGSGLGFSSSTVATGVKLVLIELPKLVRPMLRSYDPMAWCRHFRSMQAQSHNQRTTSRLRPYQLRCRTLLAVTSTVIALAPLAALAQTPTPPRPLTTASTATALPTAPSGD